MMNENEPCRSCVGGITKMNRHADADFSAIPAARCERSLSLYDASLGLRNDWISPEYLVDRVQMRKDFSAFSEEQLCSLLYDERTAENAKELFETLWGENSPVWVRAYRIAKKMRRYDGFIKDNLLRLADEPHENIREELNNAILGHKVKYFLCQPWLIKRYPIGSYELEHAKENADKLLERGLIAPCEWANAVNEAYENRFCKD